jgi:hypothetical protein
MQLLALSLRVHMLRTAQRELEGVLSRGGVISDSDRRLIKLAAKQVARAASKLASPPKAVPGAAPGAWACGPAGVVGWVPPPWPCRPVRLVDSPQPLCLPTAPPAAFLVAAAAAAVDTILPLQPVCTGRWLCVSPPMVPRHCLPPPPPPHTHTHTSTAASNSTPPPPPPTCPAAPGPCLLAASDAARVLAMVTDVNGCLRRARVAGAKFEVPPILDMGMDARLEPLHGFDLIHDTRSVDAFAVSPCDGVCVCVRVCGCRGTLLPFFPSRLPGPVAPGSLHRHRSPRGHLPCPPPPLRPHPGTFVLVPHA